MELGSVSKEIMQKVQKREIYLADLKRCLAVRICPKCGEELYRYDGAAEEGDPGLEIFTCTSLKCYFRYST